MQQASPTVQIDEAALAALVDRFYAKVRADALIGPVFNSAIHDWPVHLAKLVDFWSSVMLTTGRYKGNPMQAHLKHRATITPAMFERWLHLWAETTHDLFAPDAASALQAKAKRIAESLTIALDLHDERGQRLVSRALRAVPRQSVAGRPYKVTPPFTEETLPDALRRDHSTKAGAWGVIRVLEGQVRLHFSDNGAFEDLTPDRPGVVEPQRVHWVEPMGPMRMRVEFHDQPPVL